MQTDFERYDRDDFNRALTTLKEGGVILYPTDTVWGIGCDATNTEAVKRIYEIKQRNDAKSMLSLVGSEMQLQQIVKTVPEAAWMLIDAAVHPLTIIYDHPIGLAENLRAEDGSAGIRLTSDSFCKTLCSRLRRPIVSTSANISGEKTPANYYQISDAIKQSVDYIVEFRQSDTKKVSPSNIIKLTDSGIITIIR